MTRHSSTRAKKQTALDLPARKSTRISIHRSATDSPAASEYIPISSTSPHITNQVITNDEDLLQLLISQTKSSQKNVIPLESQSPPKRIFDLEEVPTFYPTEEQFLYPELYLASLRPHAERFGMCKIVPPSSFNPSFSADIKNLKFQPEVQKLHQIGARSRKPINFFEKIRVFQEQNGTSFRHPFLYSKTLDLYHFALLMDDYGGYERVVNDKKWAQIGRDLGYNSQGCTSISFGLRNVYETHLLPYKLFIAQGDQIKSNEEAIKKQGRNIKRSPAISSCSLCRKEKSDSLTVSCDQCDRIFHGKCLNPPLEEVFDCSFFCPICLAQYDPTFGFDQGSEYTLTGFMKKDFEFKRNYIRGSSSKNNQSPITNLVPDPEEYAIERRFWGQVSDYIDELSVEYCSDLQASGGRSGFPTLEKSPDNPLSRHPWNLNNIASNRSNLLSHIQDQSLGMSVPWIYIGMMLSAFCWHNEDHFTYSINYQHWGSPRTCYSVPASYAEKFEDVFKMIAPELFEKDPEILYQLVTMLSPADLLDRDIPVYRITQHPGEFIVTFPRAYYCGFNHGLNYTEAVNFSSVDWLPHGLECALQYQSLKRMPVFCHDELVFHVAEIATSVAEAAPLHKHLLDLRLREEGARVIAHSFTQNTIQKPYPEGTRPSDIPQCSECNVYCFMSAITCSCSQDIKKFVCTSHIKDFCDCPLSERLLAIFVSYEILDNLIAHIAERSKPLILWQNKYAKIAATCRFPELSDLELLLGEASMLQCFIPEVLALENYIDNCREWSFIVAQVLRSSQRFDDNYDFSGVIYQRIHSLMNEWRRLSFNAPIVLELRLRMKDLKKIYTARQKSLNSSDFTPDELNELFEISQRLQITGEACIWLETLVPHLFVKPPPAIKIEPQPLDTVPSTAVPPTQDNGVSEHDIVTNNDANKPIDVLPDINRPPKEDIDTWINLCTHVLSGSLTGKHANLKDRLQSIVASTEKLLSKPTLEICICNNPNTTKLLMCSECKVGYHKVCIKPRKLPGPNDNFLCPICDPLTRGSIQRKRPNFLGITKILSDAPNLRGYVPEYDLLHRLADLVSVFQKYLEEELKKGTQLQDDRVHLKGVVRLTQALEVNLQSELTEFIRLLHPRSSSPKRSLRLEDEGSPPPKVKNRKKAQNTTNGGTLAVDPPQISSTSSPAVPMMIKLESNSSAPVLTPLRSIKSTANVSPSKPVSESSNQPTKPEIVSSNPPESSSKEPKITLLLTEDSTPPASSSNVPYITPSAAVGVTKSNNHRDANHHQPPHINAIVDPPLFSIESLIGRPISPRSSRAHSRYAVPLVIRASCPMIFEDDTESPL